MKPFAFYQARLDAVSRSFALCIPQLAAPFRDRVALAYLLLRVLDTVEDAPFADPRQQKLQFTRLRGFLREKPTTDEIDAFIAGFPAAITEGERALLGDTHVLLDDAYGEPAPVRAALFRAIDRMADGMAAYARRPQPLRLVDLEDVTRYCCFVAGLVGELLTELWAIEHREAPPMALAYQFGVFLQKLNILKDQREDEEAGRFLIPDRRELLASLRDHAPGALAYLQAIPLAERGYRIFCAWSLMMGATTVATLDSARTSRRSETAAILAHTAAIAQDNAALARQFAELMPRLPEASAHVRRAKPESIEWFRASLDAPLTDAELRGLGVEVHATKVA